jgi:hypothetical protein
MAKVRAKAPTNDEQTAKERFERRKSWFSMEMRRQEANRFQQALDEDYYDDIQWTPDEQAEIRRRGQNPVVFNEIKPTINWLIGTERRMRRDFKVLARNSSAPEASDDAETKTKLLKYLDDVNRAPFHRSQAFDDAMKAGMGWMEVGITADPEDEPIYIKSESWRNMLHDSLNPDRDINQGRYVFRFREIDLDIAKGYFPDKEDELEKAANADADGSQWSNGWPVAGMLGSATVPAKWIQYDTSNYLSNPRKRVLLIECWCMEPTKETTGAAKGSSQDRVRMQMHVSIMTEFDTILEAKSPYRHNKFPFVPVWAYRRKKDGLPYGPIRSVRGPQDNFNKAMSKSQFLLSANQMRVEKSAIDNESMTQEELRDEAAAPDGLLVFADGALSGNKVQVREHMDVGQGHLALADRASTAIRSISGITGENRSMDTTAKSGKAIIAKQEQGSMLTAEFFDNMLLAHQMEGELSLANIEQFYNDEKTFSVTGDRFKLDYTTINKRDPVTGEVTNDVTRHKAQFVIGEAPWRQSMAEAAFESAMNMLAQLAPMAPQVVVSILDLVFEWSDLPNKQTILQRIRQVTGMSDPDKGDTPEQQAKKQQDAAIAQKKFELEMAKLQADVNLATSKGTKLNSDEMLVKMTALYEAAQTAAVLAANPALTPIADAALASAGFVDGSGSPQTLGPDATPAAVVPPIPGAPTQGAAAVAPPEAGQQAAPPELQQTDGAQAGIETPRTTDGAQPPENAP